MKLNNIFDFDKIRISIPSPKDILSWSFGEVKKAETINYRTSNPEPDGLFCQKIFGPIKDFECACGRYKRSRFRGMQCDKCGVQVIKSHVRRERMGHISLSFPVAHVWFYKSAPSRIGTLLKLTQKQVEQILNFDKYVVVNPALSKYKKFQIIGAEEYDFLDKNKDIDGIESFLNNELLVESGAEALLSMLKEIDLDKELEENRRLLRESSSMVKKQKYIKMIKIFEGFKNSNARPEWMILTILPVEPPELRPMVPLDGGGRFASADVNDLYRKVINRNNRLDFLMKLGAPEIVLRHEKRMLQQSVNDLFGSTKPALSPNGRPLKSLSDFLKGKRGRFRQNLLGKRVDYSGRSVIIVGPNLRLNQCGLPREMALELFKPFVFSKLLAYGYATTLRTAKKMVERNERNEIQKILEEVVSERVVLLNRAPTLHRLGIQAFEPVLVDHRSIELHPLVCTAFNADFDGDQMAVHIPLSLEAQVEARVLMMSTNNLLSPASGNPITVPSKDMVIGIYYLTLLAEGKRGEGSIISSASEVLRLLNTDLIDLHAKVIGVIEQKQTDGSFIKKTVETTPGRMIFMDLLPKHHLVDVNIGNKLLTSKDLNHILDLVYRNCGQEDTVNFVENLMKKGFEYATVSGISFGRNDLVIPETKQQIIAETQEQVNELEKQYADGLITESGKRNKIQYLWLSCREKISKEMMKVMSNPDNSVFMMFDSGARGSVNQLSQMAGMRGLMVKNNGEFSDQPIKESFLEGLSAHSYFLSTHGARKGLGDTSLRTATSGYLTRRLVDAIQDTVVTIEDCGSEEGLKVNTLTYEYERGFSLIDQMIGRVLASDIHDENGNVLIPKGRLLTAEDLKFIQAKDIDKIYIRSALLCRSEVGLCSKCYGLDLARGTLCSIGEAVGIIAAQSIGEPGTQLIMRTFHGGGAASKSNESSYLEAMIDGQIVLRNALIIKNPSGQQIVINRHTDLSVQDNMGRIRTSNILHYGSKLLVKNGEFVKKGQKIAEWDPFMVPIVAEVEGFIHYEDVIEGVTMKETFDEMTGVINRVLVDWKSTSRFESLQPRIVLKNAAHEKLFLANGSEAHYALAAETTLVAEEGSFVKVGEVIAKLPRESGRAKDMSVGLPRVNDLFEVRQPKDPAVIAPFDAVVRYNKDYKKYKKITLDPLDKKLALVDYTVPKYRYLLVQDGGEVKKGEMVIEGTPVIGDLLHIIGVEAAAAALIKEIQEVYRAQGIKINDKHLEVIISKMIRKGEVVESDDDFILVGDRLLLKELEEVNKQRIIDGKNIIVYKRVFEGITKAALNTESFISAASFQEAVRVLIDAAVKGKVDNLRGLKENVIVGRLIPAGTGLVRKMYEKLVPGTENEIFKYIS